MTAPRRIAPRDRKDLLRAIGAGRVVVTPSGTWRTVGTGFNGLRRAGNVTGRIPVSRHHLAQLEGEGVVRLNEDGVWQLTEVGQREVEENAA